MQNATLPDRSVIQYYLNEVRNYPLLTAVEELTLCLASQAGDGCARDRMIVSNLRLVLRIARQYQRSSMALEDLIEEGNLGLIHAVTKFDANRGFRFSTYAVYWIRQYVERGIMNQARVVRLPVHMGKRLNQCLKAKREWRQRYGRDARPADVAKSIGRSADEVRELLPWQESPASISTLNDEDHPLQLSCGEHENPEYQSLQSSLLSAMFRFVSLLTSREQYIINRRFGINRHREETLECIAADIGVTRERVRQIQLDALAKLRLWMHAENLDKDCLNDLSG
ncbi:MAG: sigma-70 family RNA polymerase sigma factor [Paraperlucidibaca sp.]